MNCFDTRKKDKLVFYHFQNVINWVEVTFSTYRKEMKGLPWGILYNKFKDIPQDSQKLEKEISA